MSAHILVPALDPDRPATLSHRILTDLLRGELGYDGLIVTDGMEMRAIAGTYGIERGSVLAIAAGADAICVGGGLADDETVRRLRDALVTRRPRRRTPRGTPGGRGGPGPGTGPAGRGGTGTGTCATRPRGTADGTGGVGLVAARRALRATGARPFEPLTAAALRRGLHPGGEHRRRRRDPLGRRPPNWPGSCPGTETGTFAGDGRRASRPWRRPAPAASSPWSATNTATPG